MYQEEKKNWNHSSNSEVIKTNVDTAAFTVTFNKTHGKVNVVLSLKTS